MTCNIIVGKIVAECLSIDRLPLMNRTFGEAWRRRLGVEYAAVSAH